MLRLDRIDVPLVKPRLNDYYDLPFTQEQADFAIPYLDDDIPLYLDPFLLWKSPSFQDNALHTALIRSFNHFGRLARENRERALDGIVRISECTEAGLGSASNKKGKRISRSTAAEIVDLFSQLPTGVDPGFSHVEEIQLYVDQISKDRVSDISCSLLMSFLIDFTIDQCNKWNIPTESASLEVFNYTEQRFIDETVSLPANPVNHQPLVLIPKRWLRFTPFLNYDDYFNNSFVPAHRERLTDGRLGVLNFNRQNYGVVAAYVQAKERTRDDCTNDPLFRPIAVTSAKSKLRRLLQLPTGKTENADKEYETLASQLMASLMYPHLDFADEQSRIESGTQIRDLIFYNNRTMDFLQDVHRLYNCRQLVMELKNVAAIEREHIGQLNRYLADQFGAFGVFVTRHPLTPAMRQNTIDLWSGQRRCIVTLTDEDLKLMVQVFESRQREPIEVLKRAYIDFTRACPA